MLDEFEQAWTLDDLNTPTVGKTSLARKRLTDYVNGLRAKLQAIEDRTP